MDGRERGQVLPLVTMVVVLAGVLCLAVGRLGGAAVDRARADTAADAAALAGAAGDRKDAAALAAANGGRLTSFERRGTDTRVEVAVGPAIASARARAAATQGGPAPALRAVLARAGQLLGRPVPTTAPVPGTPLPGDAAEAHRRGTAVDVPPSFVALLAPLAGELGLCQPYSLSHPVHFELCGQRLP
ncbi:MAG TPA: pilus assembly protein TadG-related protein [Acidimicrobiales bacterium]|nr:pilus assembly protein TadG-related protein [Acidimicrobiales bacterium]